MRYNSVHEHEASEWMSPAAWATVQLSKVIGITKGNISQHILVQTHDTIYLPCGISPVNVLKGLYSSTVKQTGYIIHWCLHIGIEQPLDSLFKVIWWPFCSLVANLDLTKRLCDYGSLLCHCKIWNTTFNFKDRNMNFVKYSHILRTNSYLNISIISAHTSKLRALSIHKQ